MWNYDNETLGFTVQAKIAFDSAEDYDNLAGEPGRHLLDLAAQLCYGSFNGTFRKKFCERLEAETGIKWPVKEVKKVGDKEVTIYIPEQQFFNLVKTGETPPSEVLMNQWAQEIASQIEPVSPAKSERGKPSKLNLETARAYIAKWARGESSPEAFKAAWSNANGIDYVTRFGDNVDEETVAKAVKANEDRKAALAKQANELL